MASSGQADASGRPQKEAFGPGVETSWHSVTNPALAIEEVMKNQKVLAGLLEQVNKIIAVFSARVDETQPRRRSSGLSLISCSGKLQSPLSKGPGIGGEEAVDDLDPAEKAYYELITIHYNALGGFFKRFVREHGGTLFITPSEHIMLSCKVSLAAAEKKMPKFVESAGM